jgi:hypothetical protein
MDYAILHDELTLDPLARGYAGMTHVEAAADLNTVYRTRNRTAMSGSEIFENTDPAEFAALPEGADVAGKATRNKKMEWLSFCGIDSVDPFGPAAQFVINVFGSGSTTVSNLAVARVETISRAEELGLGVVTPGDVERGWAYPAP